MKFMLSTVATTYDVDDKEVPKLEALGFVFRPNSIYDSRLRIDGDPTIEFNTIEELAAFASEWNEVIFDGENIRIYNGYNE